jgi:hypothetical protein
VIIGLTLAVLVALLIIESPRRWSKESPLRNPERSETHNTPKADMGR